jgi:thioredoxin-dependent peroxiredoxin
MIDVGDKAPDFSLQGIDASGHEKTFSLKDYKGKRLVLYFYPKDNTHGCTEEACDFRDNIARLAKSGIAVFGVSPDSLKSHANFKTRQGLTFPLLSDPDKMVAMAYGAYGEKKLYGRTFKGILRSTFLIEQDGSVGMVWRNVKAKGHVEVVLSSIG